MDHGVRRRQLDGRPEREGVTMRDLIVVGYHEMQRAADVLTELQLLESESFELADAVAAHRAGDGRLHVDRSTHPTTKEGAGRGALLAGLLGALVVAPFTGGLSLAAAATTVGYSALTTGTLGAAVGANDAGAWKRELGISDDFVREVGGLLQPGDSAVFALVRAADPAPVTEWFRGSGGTVLRTSLPPSQEEYLQQTLRG
jgi:uncharacterized membrane protein